MNLFSIKNKRVLITGGTAGIGLAVAQHFIAEGAKVAICGRREEGSKTAHSIGAIFIKMNVTDSDSVEKGMSIAAQTLGAIDLLILNAGIGDSEGTIEDLAPTTFKKVFDVNVNGVMSCMRIGLKWLSPNAGVIITSSPASVTFLAGMGAYSASKAAINALVKTWSIELASKNIRVNAVMPGIVKTEMTNAGEDPEAELEALKKFTQNGKIRQPEELGGVFQFLASNAAETITGAIIACDDGISAGYSNLVLDKLFE